MVSVSEEAPKEVKPKRTRDPSKAKEVKEKVVRPPVVVDHMVIVDRLAEELARDQVCACVYLYISICICMYISIFIGMYGR
jgi:hypothetical protein